MSDNLSQDEIDALLGVEVESVIETTEEEATAAVAETAEVETQPVAMAEAQISDVPSTPAQPMRGSSFMDEMTRGVAESFFRDCVGNSYEAFSELINVTCEFDVSQMEELTDEEMRQRFTGDTLVRVETDVVSPIPGQLSIFMQHEMALPFGDVLMGSDGSSPSVDMEANYFLAISEAFKRLLPAAIEPKFTDVIGHPFQVELKKSGKILVDGNYDFDLSDEIVLCRYAMSLMVTPPEGKVVVEFYVAMPHSFLKNVNPLHIDDFIGQTMDSFQTNTELNSAVENEFIAPTNDLVPPPSNNDIDSLTIDQNDVDALLAQVQAAMVDPQDVAPQQQVSQQQPRQQQPQQQFFQQPMEEPQQQPVYQQVGVGAKQEEFANNQQPPIQQTAIGQSGFQSADDFEASRQAVAQQQMQQQMQQAGMGMQQPSMGMQQPSQGMQQNNMNMQYPNMGMQNPNQGMMGQQMNMNQQPPMQPGQGMQNNGQNFFSGQGVVPPQGVQQVNFAPLTYSQGQGIPQNIDLLLDVPLQITVELGRTKMLIKEILELAEGSIVELDKIAGEAIDVMVNNKLVAKGEVVVIDENFGVRITSIVSQRDRLANIV